MREVSYVTKDGKATKSYTKAVNAGIAETKLATVRDAEDDKAVETLMKFWRKYRKER